MFRNVCLPCVGGFVGLEMLFLLKLIAATSAHHSLSHSCVDIWLRKFRKHCPICLNTNSRPNPPQRPLCWRTQLYNLISATKGCPPVPMPIQSLSLPWHVVTAHLEGACWRGNLRAWRREGGKRQLLSF